MQIPKLHWGDYISPDMESSGSFFTSLRFISVKHSHDFYELCLITEGKILHIINGEKQVLNKGSFLFIRPEDVHYFEAIDNDYFQFINLAITPTTVLELFNFLGSGFGPERFLKSPNPICVEIPKTEIEEAKSKLEYFILTPKCEKSIIKSDLRATLVFLITRYFPVKVWESKTSVPVWLDWLYKEMQKKDNFTGGIATMQKIACKSPEHLCREFKKHYNKTPTDFINETRLNHASNLLIYSDEKIIDIAYSVGFQNLSHFCHEFKKKYSMSPTNYRSLNQKIIGTE